MPGRAMEELARELVAAIGSGPDPALRSEFLQLLPGLSSFIIQLELAQLPYRVIASTPNIVGLAHDSQWQLQLTPAETGAAWKPLGMVNLPEDGRNHGGPLPTLYERTRTDGQIELMARIGEVAAQRNGSGGGNGSEPASPARGSSRAVGTILATAPSSIASKTNIRVTLASMAAALSLQRQAIADFSASIGSALFGPPHTPDMSEDEWEADGVFNGDDTMRGPPGASPSTDSLDWGSNASLVVGPRRWAAALLGLWVPPPPVDVSAAAPLSAGLCFVDPGHERAFLRWHARHMWRYDYAAFCLCVMLQTMLVFTNVTHFTILGVVPAWKWAVGYCHAILIAALSVRRGRAAYISHRDTVLLGWHALMLWYHHTLMRNFQGMGPPTLNRCSGVACAFLWLPFVTLVFQTRFRWLAPSITACAAVNLTLLLELCTACDGDGGAASLRRCAGRGAVKTVSMVAAALSAVYCIEWRARRVWAALRAGAEL